MRPFRSQRAAAYTLVELLLSMAIMTVLMGGLASAMLLATRAMPNDLSALDSSLRAQSVAEEVAADLFCARSFTVKSATVIEFKVADRDGDTGDDTIRYEWSGTVGAPLIRRVNGAAGVEVITDVRAFALLYGLEAQSESSTITETTTTSEAVLAYFDGWSGITATSWDQSISSTSWISEYFEVVPPEKTIEMVFTRGSLMMRRDTSVPVQGFTAAIHRSEEGGSYLPVATALTTSPIVPATDLSTTFNWQPVTFPAVSITDFSSNGYSLFVKGGSSTPVWLQDWKSTSAPDNSQYEYWTTNSGASWSPTKVLQNQRDIRFYLWGYYKVNTASGSTTNRYFLRTVRIALQVGAAAAATADTDVQILNVPEVTGL